MLCKNCGKELPIAGKFCPFCGAPIEQAGANDETAVFTALPDELNGPLDLSAFDAVMKDVHGAQDGGAADPLAATDPHMPRADELPPINVPPVRRAQGAPGAPRTTYFEQPDLDDKPFKKPSKGKKGAVIALVVVLVLALIGGGVWFVLSRQPDENLTLAEKYMKHGDFDKALEYYLAAQGEAKDPASLDQTIQLLKDFQTAQGFMDNGQYTEALAALQLLQNRVTDPDSPLYDAIKELTDKASAAQSDSQFAADLQKASDYLANKQYDQCAAQLDMLAADDTLTGEQVKQVEKLRDSLKEAREAAERQEQNQQQQQEKKQGFVDQMNQLDENDQKIAAAATAEEELDLTSTSFEAWDTLLSDMYDHLATVLNADQYASEEESYKKWVEERDAGAQNAAKDAADETAGKLAAASFKQSYTKTRCYKLLDMM
ncbi:MAG: zinc ribbon domain-containing protein [Eubacteriales bacterium]|nr:zinc ribbon domain-containing protein [Eubacteriales bacterium]